MRGLQKVSKSAIAVRVLKALRLLYYAEQRSVSMLIWKLNPVDMKGLPSYSAIKWRSYYSRKKKSTKQLAKFGLLLNLYFSSLIFISWSRFNQGLSGYSHGFFSGWQLNSRTTLASYEGLQHVLYNQLIEGRQLPLDRFHLQWADVRPLGWVSFNHQLRRKLAFSDELSDYLALDERYHGFQYRLLCRVDRNLAVCRRFKKSVWYLNVLSLRLLGFPAVVYYPYLEMLTDLSEFGYISVLPWWRALQEEGVWQADPLAVSVVRSSELLWRCFVRPWLLTELIMKRQLELILSDHSTISEQLQEYLLSDRVYLLKMLSRMYRLLEK